MHEASANTDGQRESVSGIKIDNQILKKSRSRESEGEEVSCTYPSPFLASSDRNRCSLVLGVSNRVHRRAGAC